MLDEVDTAKSRNERTFSDLCPLNSWAMYTLCYFSLCVCVCVFNMNNLIRGTRMMSGRPHERLVEAIVICDLREG